ncbi:hypothetical protein RMB13_07035 [Acinetobacter sp. V102_4]|uniref:hypothetical protein n=1 Tax=Acinetobacter sp. V102_4 TaxID=3072984 RepID=UPI00287D5548|nr:hypothetical protein [Acinetobacter sp. V102_4]MDS7929232.1 hypothetical protein [Acinetobacter sp. V102_4]
MENIDTQLFERNLLETFEDAEYKRICELFDSEDEEFYKGVRFTLAYLKAKEVSHD